VTVATPTAYGPVATGAHGSGSGTVVVGAAVVVGIVAGAELVSGAAVVSGTDVSGVGAVLAGAVVPARSASLAPELEQAATAATNRNGMRWREFSTRT
jgi:hypothetical protein